jgi:hypothetical protein
MGPTSGTGLGLTVVWSTAQDHKGVIIVEKNAPGTTFRIYFPSTHESLGTHPAAVELKDLYGNGERLLIVDDDYGHQRDFQFLKKTSSVLADTKSREGLHNLHSLERH